MTKHGLTSSARGAGQNSIQVTATVTFTGPGVAKADLLAEQFTKPLRAQLTTLAESAATAMTEAHEESERATHAVLDDVLSKVDPSHHAAIRERFGVSA